jgi:molecular chaperone DnaK (HSP70)
VIEDVKSKEATVDMKQAFEHDVFINYAHENRDAARQLVQELEQVGLRLWFDQSSLFLGEEWERSIRSAIRNSRFFLALLSSQSVANQGYVKKEMDFAQEELRNRPGTKVFILPVRLEECHFPLPEIQKLQWIDLFPSWEAGFRRMVRILLNQQLSGKDLEIIGFDLGHGESAVARTTLFSNAEPKAIDLLNGKTSILTAVSLHPKKGLVIGDDAYRSQDPDQMHILFKSSRFDRPEVADPIRLFIQECLRILARDGKITLGEDTRFVVGCPSGWTQEDRQTYGQLLHGAGLTYASIRPESRAAFLDAKESGSLSSFQQLAASVLIIDIGSSTTDFTMVKAYKEKPLDFGHNRLGGGLLDILIFERALEAYGEGRAKFAQLFAASPPAKAKCLLTCRNVKETYFAKDNEEDWIDTPAAGYEKLDRGLYFEVDLHYQDMQEILSTPVNDLGNRTWPDAFREEIFKCQQSPDYHPPKLVLMTGGGSRMRFTQAICREMFPGAEIRVGLEPSLTIAKGLALVGRIDLKVQAFREEVDDFLVSETLPSTVEASLPKLFQMISETFYVKIVALSKESVKRWVSAEIDTIDALQEEIKTRMNKLLAAEGSSLFEQDIQRWLEGLSKQIENLTAEICDKYGIPRAAFNLKIAPSKVGAGIPVIDASQPVRQAFEDITSVVSGTCLP